jgi:L-arabinonolactonase
MATVIGDAELVADCRNTLGEGVLWSAEHRRVYWTDITESKLWELDPKTGKTAVWSLPARLGSFAFCGGSRLLLALEKQLAYFDLSGEKPIVPLREVERDTAETRSNDGRCDRAGNFVFGSMNDRFDGRPLGAFYQFSRDCVLKRLALGDVQIANSICFSPDGRTLYYCDSPLREIRCCCYDAATAQVSQQRLFASLGDQVGVPDGSVVDADGCVWNAVWGGGCVVRYRPDGSRDAVINVPVPNPTCVGFGGDRLDELYITTSRQEMTNEQLAAAPTAGGLYRVKVPVHGIPEPRFTSSLSGRA